MPCSLPPYSLNLWSFVHRTCPLKVPRTIAKTKRATLPRFLLEKWLLISAISIFLSCCLVLLFFRNPYYSVLSGIIGSKFAVLLLYFFLSKAWKPWFYCIPSFKDFIVGIESRFNVLSCIIKYYSKFLNFFATYYHALFRIMQSEFVALLLYLQNSVALQHIHQGLFPKKCVDCVISFRLLLFSSYQ